MSNAINAFKNGNGKLIGGRGKFSSRCEVGLFFGHLDSQHLKYLEVHVPPHEQTHEKIFHFLFAFFFRRLLNWLHTC